MIPYGRQDITAADIQAVVEVLQSDFLTQGPAVPAFELAVTTRVGVRYAVAVSSATSALHIACLALDVGPGDVLWTVPNTFVASANCALYCGAAVDFVDIDPDTWNMSVAALKVKLVQARTDGTLPKVVVPVHFGGQPTEQRAIWELAQEFGFKVVEDASHAIGATGEGGEPAGSCRWSDITVFSFHPVKIITTGEGGMALTNSEELAHRMQMFRSHGITRDAARLEMPSPGGWYYEQQLLGFNYRMTDIQAALGCSQMKRLDDYLDRRNFLAQRYDELLAGLDLQLPTTLKHNRSSFHLYVVRIKSQLKSPAKGHLRADVFKKLRDSGVGANVHYMPVHLQPFYRRLGFTEGSFPAAEAYGAEAISLPLYPGLNEEGQTHVAAVLNKALS